MDLFSDGGEGWRILCPPLPGMPWGNQRLPFVPHRFQCGGGRRDPALFVVGGAYVDRRG